MLEKYIRHWKFYLISIIIVALFLIFGYGIKTFNSRLFLSIICILIGLLLANPFLVKWYVKSSYFKPESVVFYYAGNFTYQDAKTKYGEKIANLLFFYMIGFIFLAIGIIYLIYLLYSGS